MGRTVEARWAVLIVSMLLTLGVVLALLISSQAPPRQTSFPTYSREAGNCLPVALEVAGRIPSRNSPRVLAAGKHAYVLFKARYSNGRVGWWVYDGTICKTFPAYDASMGGSAAATLLLGEPTDGWYVACE